MNPDQFGPGQSCIECHNRSTLVEDSKAITKHFVERLDRS